MFEFNELLLTVLKIIYLTPTALHRSTIAANCCSVPLRVSSLYDMGWYLSHHGLLTFGFQLGCHATTFSVLGDTWSKTYYGHFNYREEKNNWKITDLNTSKSVGSKVSFAFSSNIIPFPFKQVNHGCSAWNGIRIPLPISQTDPGKADYKGKEKCWFHDGLQTSPWENQIVHWLFIRLFKGVFMENKKRNCYLCGKVCTCHNFIMWKVPSVLLIDTPLIVSGRTLVIVAEVHGHLKWTILW